MWRSGTSGPLSSIAAALCAVVVSGCAEFRLPRIDPSGEHLFATPGAATGRPDDLVAVSLAPQRTVAPVGSQVVLLAGTAAADGYLRTNRRLEWSIAPGSVGQFVSVGQPGWIDPLVGDFNRPRRVTGTFAVGSTSRRQERVGVGPGFAAPVCVRPGQGWITVTSPVEGTSHILVVAPEVVAVCGRSQSAVIHWIDAQFGFPPPAINPAGTRHVLTTTVLRQSNQCPQAGWIVRYEIAGGPPAGFAPGGAAAVEVLTNAAGQASTEIFQSQPTPGTNQIRIQVIRPPSAGDPGGERLVVGSGGTLKTWTAAALSVRQSGPTAAAVGATLAYCIEVCNSGDQPARDVTASDELPDGLTFVSGTPPPAVSGRRLQWQLGELAPGQRRTLQIECRAAQAGSVAHCVEVAAAGGVRANHCTTTTIFLPMLDVQVTGPERATVGGQVTFQIVVTNRSQAAATGLIIKDRFGPGFEHATVPSPIERTLGDLGPGQSRTVNVTFRITRAGPLCHTVEIVGAEGVRATPKAALRPRSRPAAGPPLRGANLRRPNSPNRPPPPPPPSRSR